MKKYLFETIVTLLLSSCISEDKYIIEGRMSNLESTTLYVVYEGYDNNAVDTLECNEKGHFHISRETGDEISEINIYYNDKKNVITVYPSSGKTVEIDGDAHYPRLTEIKGGEVNNKLTQFKMKAAALLKEQTDIENNTSGSMTPQLVNVQHEIRRLARNFIIDNPKEEASVILISEYFSRPEDIPQATELLAVLAPELKDNATVKTLKAEIEQAKTTIAGAKAPWFSVMNIDGTAISPASFINKYWIIAFTASWCDMCRTEVLMLDRISTEHSRDSLDILLVSLDDNAKDLREMMKSDTLKWNLVCDSAGQAIDIFEKYNVNYMPDCYMIDKDGIIRLRTANGTELKNTVDELMR
ncbi:MAG: AhpC/TSA family protein [Tannerella sp.]|nr:AhpC/TSA family protein [Tannerella sp.]